MPLVERAREVITIARAALTAAITAAGLRARSAELTRVAAITAASRAAVAHPSFRSLATDEVPAPPLTRAPAAIISIVLGAPAVLGTPATVVPAGVWAGPPGALPASVGA